MPSPADTQPDPDSPSRSTLQTFLEWELARATEELTDARERLAEKDSPANRKAVADCRAQFDVLLDMHHDATAFLTHHDGE